MKAAKTWQAGGMKALSAPARNGYPSDLRDEEWALLKPLVPAVKSGGQPARHMRREIVNAILSVVQDGNQWRALPSWQTAYTSFRLWRNGGDLIMAQAQGGALLAPMQARPRAISCIGQRSSCGNLLRSPVA